MYSLSLVSSESRDIALRWYVFCVVCFLLLFTLRRRLVVFFVVQTYALVIVAFTCSRLFIANRCTCILISRELVSLFLEKFRSRRDCFYLFYRINNNIATSFSLPGRPRNIHPASHHRTRSSATNCWVQRVRICQTRRHDME